MITQAKLKELLHYNPDTGVFTWLVNKGSRAPAGSEAGNIHQDGRTSYRLIMIDGASHKAHRLAWLYVHGEFPKNDIGHEDHDGLHNWISNLRDVTNSENNKNKSLSCNNTSGVVGVSLHKGTGKWRAQISTESGRKHLGYFTNKEDAIEAAKAARVKYGYHENHGSTR
jgi:hypothetical protein